MQDTQPSIDNLIKMLMNPQSCNPKNNKKKSQNASNGPENMNQEIQNLDIDDYLQLFAHQKKHLNARRWAKLFSINQSMQMEQQSYKHFFAIASQANYRRLEHPGYFKLLLTMVKTYPPTFFVAIQKDIPRTLTSTNPFQQLLRNVLYAYAIRNPSLLYCQGMNYIVAFLLINEMSQQQAFWFMVCLIQNFLPDDYFKDLTTVSITTCIFNLLLQEIFPQFKLEMTDVGMQPSIILVPWFVCLFTKGFINSVSAYLINYILLQGRKYRIGYILLKIALGLIAIVISKPQSFAFTKDFKTFKDLLQTRIFEVSLAEIQQNLQYIEFNYEIYVKIEDYYRRQKQELREEILKGRDKKIPLPPCNSTFPVCFHRIQMEKRLGCIENALILKNGYDIRQQMIDNYLQRPQQDNMPDIHFNDTKQCPIGRQAHICHLNAQDYHLSMNSRKHKFQRETVHKIEIIKQDEESVEQEMQLSTLQERFAEHSQYFQIDQNYIENQVNCDEEFKKELEEFSREKVPQSIVKEDKINEGVKQEIKEKVSLKAKLGNVFKRVFEKMSDFNKTKELRKSQCDLSPKKQIKQ